MFSFQGRTKIALNKVIVKQDTWAMITLCWIALRPGGGTPHMKGVGMLVVSLRGVNFGF